MSLNILVWPRYEMPETPRFRKGNTCNRRQGQSNQSIPCSAMLSYLLGSLNTPQLVNALACHH